MWETMEIKFQKKWLKYSEKYGVDYLELLPRLALGDLFRAFLVESEIFANDGVLSLVIVNPTQVVVYPANSAILERPIFFLSVRLSIFL